MNEREQGARPHDWPWALALAGIVLGLGLTLVGRWWL